MLIKSCCLLLFIFSECLTTRITRLEVPAAVRLGAPELLLDCQYELESDEGLVVTWYFNKELVYQWIKEGEPSARGILKDHLDLKYNVSALPTQRYRAMRLLNPEAVFSGDYECKVSTYASEDTAHQHMQLYDPGEGPVLSYEVVAGNETVDSAVSMECEAGGVFPQPEITILVDGKVVNQSQTNEKTPEERYNSSATASLPAAELAPGAELSCDLTLPRTPYNGSFVLSYTDVEVTSEAPAAEAESARPAAVGAGSRWAAGGVDGGLSASGSLLLAGLVVSLCHLLQQRHEQRA